MNEPKWKDIAEYAYQRADTLFGDVVVIGEEKGFDNKAILDLAYEYQHIGEHIDRLIRVREYLGDLTKSERRKQW